MAKGKKGGAPIGNQNALGNEGGRPKAKLSELPKGWQSQVLELYEQGASDVEAMALLYKLRGSFSKTIFKRWMKEEVKFRSTIKRGHMLAQAWWEMQGRTNLNSYKDGPAFSSTLWYMNMKNRYGWKDKNELSGPNNSPLISGIEIIIHDGKEAKDSHKSGT